MRLLKWFWLLLLFLTPQLAFADSAPLRPAGPTLQPMGETRVRMDSERIDINVRRARPDEQPGGSLVAEVSVRFRFVPGEDEAVTAGFPVQASMGPQRFMVEAIQDFSVAIDGAPVNHEVKRAAWNGEVTDWAVWDLPFRKGVPRTVDVRYVIRFSPYGKGPAADLHLFYILQTGQYWAGPIGLAEASVKLEAPVRPEDVAAGTTTGWQVRDGALYWQWVDLEPDFDLVVQLENSFWLDGVTAAQRLLAKSPRTLSDLYQAQAIAVSLLQGDVRNGGWTPVRGGIPSGKAAEVLIAPLRDALRQEAAKAPDNWELRQRYLQLLHSSAIYIAEDGYALHDTDSLKALVPEFLRYRKDSPAGRVYAWWSHYDFAAHIARTTYHRTQDPALRQLTLQAILDVMPAAFSSKQEAASWVSGVAKVEYGPAPVGLREELEQVALTRVKESPSPPPQAPAPEAPLAPEPPATPEPEPDPEPINWAPFAGAVLALLGAALLIRRRTRRHG